MKIAQRKQLPNKIHCVRIVKHKDRTEEDGDVHQKSRGLHKKKNYVLSTFVFNVRNGNALEQNITEQDGVVLYPPKKVYKKLH